MTSPASPPYRYRPEILQELAIFGLHPRATTSPGFVRDYLRDLYKWEIRGLRDRYRARAFPKHEFADRVIVLRRKYVLLSIPVETWVEPRPPGGPAGIA
jgi:hypothetical protein